MSKLKKFLAVTSALLICMGTMAYMPQGSFVNADTKNAYAAEESVAINETNFPDELFRQFVAENFDKDKDDMLSSKEIDNVTEICVTEKNISELNGIEHFKTLVYLDCSKNQLTSLDVSNNTALEYLYCFENQLTSLDVSNNTVLKDFWCGRNQLTSLDVSKNTALESLDCDVNQLTSLDIKNNIALINLSCNDNQLASLDISNNTKLSGVFCYRNQLTSLDVNKNTELCSLACNNNKLTTLDVSNNLMLIELQCCYNQLSNLDVSNNIKLSSLICHTNKLTSLDLSNNIELSFLYCGLNQLTSLDLSKNEKLDTNQDTMIENLNYDDNTYEITLTDGEFDLSTLPTGFDITKASEWTNGTIEGNILTVEDASKNVTYTYDCGNEKTATFTLVPNVKQNSLLGDINGNNIVDSSDASNVLAVYALVSTGKESGLTAEQKTAADVNGDGVIDAADASLILAYYAHISTGGTGTLEEFLKS